MIGYRLLAQIYNGNTQKPFFKLFVTRKIIFSLKLKTNAKVIQYKIRDKIKVEFMKWFGK